MAWFNLRWLLQGEQTGNGELTDWLSHLSTRDSATEKRPTAPVGRPREAPLSLAIKRLQLFSTG